MRSRIWVAWQFIRLTRPIFLGGGILLNLLGALTAVLDGAAFQPGKFLLGQALITSVQLMTHYANEYFDLETDRLNTQRTWFSGGSGVLSAGSLPVKTAQSAALIFALASLVAVIVAGWQVQAVFWLGLAAWFAAWSYSGPPLTLVKTGWGELSASLVVAGMVPLVGYMMQTGGFLSPTLLLSILPLILLHFAMLIAFQIPDRSADQAAGKRTIAVRMGLPGVIWLHNISLIVAFCVILTFTLLGWPGAKLAWLPIPIAAWQAAGTRAFTGSETLDHQYNWLTTRALLLFALTTLLWLVGVTLALTQS